MQLLNKKQKPTLLIDTKGHKEIALEILFSQKRQKIALRNLARCTTDTVKGNYNFAGRLRLNTQTPRNLFPHSTQQMAPS